MRPPPVMLSLYVTRVLGLAPAANADLLSEDPSEDIRNLRLLQTVVLAGQNAVLR